MARASLVLWMCFAYLACGKDKPTGPDSTPPAAVSAFSATILGSDTVRLTWTAPGDDGQSGKAAAYDARRSHSPITGQNFEHADTLGSLPSPAKAGSPEQLFSTNLPGSSTQFFAVRAADERGNWSGIAALGPITTLPDTVPPARVSDLAVVGTTANSLTLSWTAPGDDGVRGRSSRLEVRYLAGALDDQNWGTAHLLALPSVNLVRGGSHQMVPVEGIPRRVRVEVALRSFDEVDGVSGTSNSVNVTLRGSPREWVVRNDRSGDTATIQASLDSCMEGDSIWVEPGVYHEILDFKGKAVALRSRQGADKTTLDGLGLGGPVVSFKTAETRRSILEGFTVTRGSGVLVTPLDREGGGIYCEMSSPTIRANTIRGNVLPEPYSAGGGVAIHGRYEPGPEPTPLLIGNTIEDNSVGHAGGGVEVFYASAVLIDNVIRRNRCGYDGAGLWGFLRRGHVTIAGGAFIENVAGDHGGAIEASNSGTTMGPSYTVSGVIFVRNVAEGRDVPDLDVGAGGAISARQTQGLFIHNTFVGNAGARVGISCPGGAILLDGPTGPLSVSHNIFYGSRGCGISCYSAPSVAIEHNLFWDNVPQAIGQRRGSCSADTLELNIIADPMFCQAGSDNYHLSLNSPATLGEEVSGAFLRLGCENSARWYMVPPAGASLNMSPSVGVY